MRRLLYRFIGGNEAVVEGDIMVEMGSKPTEIIDLSGLPEAEFQKLKENLENNTYDRVSKTVKVAKKDKDGNRIKTL